MSDLIPAGETAVFFSPSSGYFGQESELLSNYNVLFTVDPDNTIAETNEQNNRQPGCYSPLSEIYAEGACTNQRRIQGDSPNVKSNESSPTEGGKKNNFRNRPPMKQRSGQKLAPD